MGNAFNSIKRGLLEAIERAEGRAPHGPSLALLNVIAHNPNAVIEALVACARYRDNGLPHFVSVTE